MNQKKFMLLAIILLTIGSIITILKVPTKFGLDLIGGARLVLEAQTTDNIVKITPEVMDSLQFAIEKRVNALGVSETIVQKAGDKRLIVEIPNVKDLKQAKQFLGDTAELEFKELKKDDKGQPVIGANGEEWISTGLSGKDLRKAEIGNDQTGHWVVSLEFNDEGAKKFATLTTRLVGQPMAIFFNGEIQSAPVINEPIRGGMAQISGGRDGFDIEEARDMVNLLNAGALPVPAEIIEENTVGPTLGLDSLKKSKTAGFIGLGLVILFMIAYYRLPGVIASVALVIYGLMSLAIFKIVPVTLTLAGIAGFILSIGMAVDANILIFERTKEELKMGKTFYAAINAGFERAFTSIFDSNMTTLITCAILYMLGSSIVRGFALTLAIGVLLSMFSAITITRNFMHVFFDHFNLEHPGLFGLKENEIQTAFKAEDTTANKAKYGVLD